MIPEEIRDRLIEVSSGCWEWTGSRNNRGYGTYRAQMVHRLVWEHARSALAPGDTIDHLCRNKACANPDHLEPVSGRVNILRSRGYWVGETDSDGMRKCIACGLAKPIATYPKHTRTKSGYRADCHECHIEKKAALRAKRRAAGLCVV